MTPTTPTPISDQAPDEIVAYVNQADLDLLANYGSSGPCVLYNRPVGNATIPMFSRSTAPTTGSASDDMTREQLLEALQQQDNIIQGYSTGLLTAAPVAWMRTYRQFSDVPIDPDPGYMVTSFHQNADFAAKYPDENVPLYDRPANPAASGPKVTPKMIDAAAKWLTGLQHMRATDKRGAIEQAITAVLLAASMGGDKS